MKRYGTLVGLVALLVIAVYVNVKLNSAPEVEPSATPMITATVVEPLDEDFFATFRTDRQSARDKEIEYLEAIILHEQTDEETLLDAQQQKIDIVDGMETEFTVESLLKSKGFTDAAVIVHSGSVNVMVNAPEELTEQQAAQVLDIVVRETGQSAENVKISTVK